ncbi:MAG: glutamate racemase [Saprospiraceae bacterium]
MSAAANASDPVGIFDSGIGGLSVVDAIVRLLPKERLLYFGDTARIPYGTKSPDTIREYSAQITRFLLDQGCKAIVVACNTASAPALSFLRAQWPEVPIVGMEPAVKPGAQATKTGKVGVLATRGTLQSERYATLMTRFASHIQVMEDPCIGLVERIEQEQFESPETEALLRSIMQPMLEKGVDTFVLGCTHYPFVEPLIRRIAGEQAAIINPAPAVARQLARMLQERNLLSPALEGKHAFYASKPTSFLETFAAGLLSPGTYTVQYHTLS